MNIVVLHFCRKDSSMYTAQSCGLHQLCMLSERLVRFCLNFECPSSVGCFSANRLKQRKLKVTKIKSLFLID